MNDHRTKKQKALEAARVPPEQAQSMANIGGMQQRGWQPGMVHVQRSVTPGGPQVRPAVMGGFGMAGAGMGGMQRMPMHQQQQQQQQMMMMRMQQPGQQMRPSGQGIILQRPGGPVQRMMSPGPGGGQSPQYMAGQPSPAGGGMPANQSPGGMPSPAGGGGFNVTSPGNFNVTSPGSFNVTSPNHPGVGQRPPRDGNL